MAAGRQGDVADPDSLVARVRVYAPSLEELIEGCGMLFSQLNGDVEGGWAAIGGAEGTGGSGKDPVEAVVTSRPLLSSRWLELPG